MAAQQTVVVSGDKNAVVTIGGKGTKQTVVVGGSGNAVVTSGRDAKR